MVKKGHRTILYPFFKRMGARKERGVNFVIYLLLLVLGLALVAHSYLIMSLLKSQREIQLRLKRLSRPKEPRRPVKKAALHLTSEKRKI